MPAVCLPWAFQSFYSLFLGVIPICIQAYTIRVPAAGGCAARRSPRHTYSTPHSNELGMFRPSNPCTLLSAPLLRPLHKCLESLTYGRIRTSVSSSDSAPPGLRSLLIYNSFFGVQSMGLRSYTGKCRTPKAAYDQSPMDNPYRSCENGVVAGRMRCYNSKSFAQPSDITPIRVQALLAHTYLSGINLHKYVHSQPLSPRRKSESRNLCEPGFRRSPE